MDTPWHRLPPAMGRARQNAPRRRQEAPHLRRANPRGPAPKTTSSAAHDSRACARGVWPARRGRLAARASTAGIVGVAAPVVRGRAPHTREQHRPRAASRPSCLVGGPALTTPRFARPRTANTVQSECAKNRIAIAVPGPLLTVQESALSRATDTSPHEQPVQTVRPRADCPLEPHPGALYGIVVRAKATIGAVRGRQRVLEARR